MEWISVYRFQCRRLESFVHGSIIFAGDAAHQVSPFGARGANSGVQDADNLGWKLAAVLEGKAAAPHAASVREEEFAEAAAEGDEKPARRAPAKKTAKKGDEAQA